jgi:predicted membrane protein (TIGR00267 family)
MSETSWRLRRDHLLPLVLGLSDGVLTALTLAAGSLVDSLRHMTFGLALRIAISALASSAFVFLVARYSQLRGELVNAERQLNLTSHGRLAASSLGQAIRREAIVAAILSSLASFMGALIPLVVAVLFPANSWVAIAVALMVLGLLGVGLAKTVFGNPLYWSGALVLGGIVLSVLGVRLRIV